MNTVPPKDEQPEILDDEVEASRAPLLEHVTELRSRLIQSLVALMVGTIACFFFAQEIFELLLAPFALMAESQDSPNIFSKPAFPLSGTFNSEGFSLTALLAIAP